jgi:5-methylcytosine-specific restriction endonuclease McrA
VLERDGHRCRTCGAIATEVDHVTAGDDHRLANLQALCTPCHRAKSSAEGVEARRVKYDRRRPDDKHPGLT